MASLGKVVANCPYCGPKPACDLLHTEKTHNRSDGIDFWVSEEMFRCCGCGEVFLRKDHYCSEDCYWDESRDEGDKFVIAHDYEYLPPPIRIATPQWMNELDLIDRVLGNFTAELYSAINADLLSLAAIGARTVLDRCFNLLDIDDKGGFRGRLNELYRRDYVGGTERDLLMILTDAGNAAAHRAWRPNAEQMGAIMSILEQFLHRTFVLRDELRLLGRDIPPRH